MTSEVYYNIDQELLICKSPGHDLKYRVFQIYGQKYVKLMDTTTTPEPSTEVYAANIPRNILIDNLFRFFVKCGEIYQIRLLMDFSGCNRGRCFVQYRRVLASREAICCLHDEIIENEHRVVVKLSLNNNQLILKSIPNWISEQHVKDIIERVIGEGLTRVAIKRSRVPFRNYCFCTYRDHQFAIMAHKKSWPFIHIAGGAVIDVHWAVPELLRHSVNLYFTNFCLTMTKMELFEAFVRLIDVKTLVQFRITNGYGFITFSNNESLKKAEVVLKDLTIRGLTLQFSRLPFTVTSCEGSRMYYNYKQNSAGRPKQLYGYYGYYPLRSGTSPYTINMPVYMPRVQHYPYPSYHNYYHYFYSGAHR